jgi:hypothetical protein
MITKLSYRDSGADLVASSLYFSTVAIRAMQEISKKFPGYNDKRTPNHAQAIEYVIEQLSPLIDSSSRAHDVDRPAVIEKLKGIISEGMS